MYTRSQKRKECRQKIRAAVLRLGGHRLSVEEIDEILPTSRFDLAWKRFEMNNFERMWAIHLGESSCPGNHNFVKVDLTNVLGRDHVLWEAYNPVETTDQEKYSVRLKAIAKDIRTLITRQLGSTVPATTEIRSLILRAGFNKAFKQWRDRGYTAQWTPKVSTVQYNAGIPNFLYIDFSKKLLGGRTFNYKPRPTRDTSIKLSSDQRHCVYCDSIVDKKDYRDNRLRCRKCSNKVDSNTMHTEKGKLQHIYRDQRKSSIKRGHPEPTYSFDEFQAWAYGNGFKMLYHKWAASGFDRGLAPSGDRVNDELGYDLANLRLTTNQENIQSFANNKSQKEGKYRSKVYDDEHVEWGVHVYSADCRYLRSARSLKRMMAKLGLDDADRKYVSRQLSTINPCMLTEKPRKGYRFVRGFKLDS